MANYRFRRGYLTMIFGALLFSGLGVILFFVDFEDGGSGRRASLVQMIPFAKEILLFICFAAVAVNIFAFFTRRPSLIANAEGLTFTTLWNKTYEIAWQDVKAIDVTKQFLVFHYHRDGKLTKVNVGGMFKLKPRKMLEKMRTIAGGNLLRRS